MVRIRVHLLAEEATQPNPDVDEVLDWQRQLLAEEATQPNPDRLSLFKDV